VRQHAPAAAAYDPDDTEDTNVTALKARTIATSLVIVGGIVMGAAPIAAQDTAPLDTTSSTRTVAAPSTTLPPRQGTVQAPTTTIVSTPPTTTPPTTTSHAPSTTATTQPGSVQAPSGGQATPPSLPPDTPPSLPDDICKEWDVCGPPPPMPSLPQPIEVEDDPEIAAPTTSAATPARSFSANDAAAPRDGLRVYRALKLQAAMVKVAAAINTAIDSLTADPGSTSAPAGEGEDEGGECVEVTYEVCIDWGGDGPSDDDTCWTEETSCPDEEE
jgi:hypothetical protein